MEHKKLKPNASPEAHTPEAENDGGSHPTPTQRRWLARGLGQPGGKLPLFDEHGQKVSERTVRSCIHSGWAEPWFSNPLKPDWLICKITSAGIDAVTRKK